LKRKILQSLKAFHRVKVCKPIMSRWDCFKSKSDYSIFHRPKRQKGEEFSRMEGETMIVSLEEGEMRFPPKAGVILIDPIYNKVLLVKHRYGINLEGNAEEIEESGHWSIPKGHKNKDESLAECAMRELFEETSITVRIEADQKYIKNNNTCYYVVFYDSTIQLPEPIDIKEIYEMRWISLIDILEYNVNKDTKTILIKRLPTLKWIVDKIKETTIKIPSLISEKFELIMN
jgi:bis(5'-nucleosidyl)-tetraphosphatase